MFQHLINNALFVIFGGLMAACSGALAAHLLARVMDRLP